MNFPAANRDPEVFDDADTVVLDRAVNRHVASARASTAVRAPTWPAWSCASRSRNGCAGSRSSASRMAAEVTWAGGQVRGPRQLPVVFP